MDAVTFAPTAPQDCCLTVLLLVMLSPCGMISSLKHFKRRRTALSGVLNKTCLLQAAERAL